MREREGVELVCKQEKKRSSFFFIFFLSFIETSKGETPANFFFALAFPCPLKRIPWSPFRAEVPRTESPLRE